MRGWGLLAQPSLNNLGASMLWHRLVCPHSGGDPEGAAGRLLERKTLAEPAVLYLSTDEAGWQPSDCRRCRGSWTLGRRLACFLLSRVRDLGIGKHLFLIESGALPLPGVSVSQDSFSLSPVGGALPLPGVSVSQDSLSLNGSLRSVLDGVLNPEECGAILRLAKAAAASGDGYRGRRSPHTPHEKFDGLTVLRALRLSQEGSVSQSDARLFFDAGERARLLLQSYFNSPSPLYFSFTHLVCRAAVPVEYEVGLSFNLSTVALGTDSGFPRFPLCSIPACFNG
ncbi:UNVERIFIED_CONTAM: hypothetical protein FKN15_025630 [Acipenser sinensis]